jgi:hypothetical protein
MKARKIRKYLKQGLLMKAFVQEEGIDFTQIFSLVNQNVISKSSTWSCSFSRFRVGEMRCQRSLPPWRFGGRDVYGAAKRIYSKR